MNWTPKHIILTALLLLMGGTMMAQTDPLYVIKRRTDAGVTGTHYLSHVKSGNNWVLQDATEFNLNCLWYSGNTVDMTGDNHNYYFIEETAAGKVYHFLHAPLTAGGAIGVSDTLPSPQMLRNKEQIYYFYDWDWDAYGGGVARGYKHTGLTQGECQAHTAPTYSWGSGECWEVYWVECTAENVWKLVDASHYTLNNPEEPVRYAARFRSVVVTPHDIEVTNVTMGLLDKLNDITLATPDASQSLSVTSNGVAPSTYSYSFIPAYTTYVFEGETHNYYDDGDGEADQGENTPTETLGSGTPDTYKWTITGPGARYLSFAAADSVTVATEASPTLHYYRPNETGHKTATLTLTVTYSNGITQVRTATVTVKTPCENPLAIGDPVVIYDYVTVSWVNTAEKYLVEWKKQSDNAWNPGDTAVVKNNNTYTFSGLDYSTAYHYRVTAFCGGDYLDPPAEDDWGKFTTKKQTDLLINGAVYGGGRVADVTGHTEVIIINCDSIGAVYGGNDIAGSVLDADGSSIVLGVNQNDANATAYNGGKASTKVRVNDVYGGGNGYYAYNGSSFTAASSSYNSQSVAAGGHVLAMTPTNQVGDVVWTNEGTDPVTLNFPKIVKTNITVTNDQVKVDSVFGGAKNAFVTHIIGTNSETGKPIYAENGSTITVDGGTILAVYGGNNIGGGQGYGKHRINVSHTTTNLTGSIANTDTTGFGRDFGIRYLFGGGNKVAGSTTNVFITGGQLDTIFGGGNEADVYAANLTVNCALGAYDSEKPYIYGNAYSKAINSTYYSGHYTTPESFDVKMIDTVNYTWDGYAGIYNVRTLFGGNNQANMNSVPNINLNSGSVGTVYGGGNAGDMLIYSTDDCTEQHNDLKIRGNDVKYGTHVVMNSPTMLVDYLYGGCQISNVDYSTWVEIKSGHVGNVYGGCNVSGDVGSTRLNDQLEPFDPDGPNVTLADKRAYYLQYQQVQGATFVVATGGVVYKTLFAGGNGYYHCNDGICYSNSPVVHYGDPEGKYIGMTIPTHNETHVIVSTGTTVRGNVYAGGNMAPVGFNTGLVGNSTIGIRPFPKFVGYASVTMDGGTVLGDVYGGGNMAAVYGSNEVQVSGGKIEGALYGGNDKLGMVAQITNRALPAEYFLASDGNTPLTDVDTYIGLTGTPDINIVYGGGNGDYDYDNGEFCNPENNKPIQSNIFVDINIDGYPADGGGHINTVYGGGNGVTVTDKTTVFLNIKGENDGEPLPYDHVGTIFGGNNKGHLDILADIILLKGQVNTVYGGCNQGAMIGDKTVTGSDNTQYEHVGSVVRLRDEYTVTNSLNDPPTIHHTFPTAKVSGAVYGGCRMNGVNNNSLVLVEGGNHSTASIFGGSDISGDVGGTSQVVVSNGTHGTNATVLGNVYGGGNGNYDYDDTYSGWRAPYCVNALVEMKSGTVANLFAGAYAGPCGVTTAQVDGGTVTNKVFGGGNMAGTVTSNSLTTTEVDELGNVTITTVNKETSGTSTVNFNSGTVNAGIYGGCNASGTIASAVNVNIRSNLGANGTPLTDGIFGGGYGAATRTNGNVTVTIDNESNPTIWGDIYGGSALGWVNDASAETPNLTKIDFQNGTLHGNIYGGGMGCLADDVAVPPVVATAALVNGKVEVAIGNGTLYNNIYGGCNVNGTVKNDIKVNVTGGSIGVNGVASASVFGGGYGNLTATEGNVEVDINGASAYVYGDVYGGSGYGNVNKVDNDNTTTVNILNGFIKQTTVNATNYGGNVYGGGLGDKAGLGSGHYNYAAAVNGKVYVNIGATDGAVNPTFTGNAVIDGAVYGCNNLNGSPQDSVFVNIYKMHHGGTPATNHYPMSTPSPHTEWSLAALEANAEEQTYALSAVYGGGNQAAYTPPLDEHNHPKTTTVHIYDCKENTVCDVYGGGNAADVGIEDTQAANTIVIVDGGRIHRVFGGGNGYSASNNHANPNGSDYNPGANIYGKASSYIHAGLIDEVYGGANMWGSVDEINLNLDGSNDCGDQIYGSVFGCANAAPLNHSITTTIKCGVGTIGQLYGGSYQAPIGTPGGTGASVTLNLYGGEYEKVFGGSKGKADDPDIAGDQSVPANIYGDVTLNLYGGKVIDAFGGSDVNGIIKGVITVNVLDHENSTCPLDLNNIYGASNQTTYKPDMLTSGELPTSPVVNVMHIKRDTEHGFMGIKGNVYGGAYGDTATVVSNPQVNIGYVTSMASEVPDGYSITEANRTAYVCGDVYGGGKMADVENKDDISATATVNLLNDNARVAHIYGGGHQADVNNTKVNIEDGVVATAVYGGCNVMGTITGNTEVNILGDLGATGVGAYDVTVFGGGQGQNTDTKGNVTVNIGNGTATFDLYGTVYGGSALGSVNDGTEDLTKVHLKSGTIHGNVFGGGLGKLDDPNTGGVDESVEAFVKGNIKVVADGTTVTDANTAIFGANDQNGNPAGTVTVEINGGEILNVVGGGNVAEYSAPVGNPNYPFVNIKGGSVTHKVVGGGNNANITGNPTILIEGGTVATNGAADAGVYGGCNTTGVVYGNTTVTITGDNTANHTTIGTTTNRAGIFGGGYGEPTKVNQNVTVTFGDDTNVAKTYPILYGDLYGGSALGDVNYLDKDQSSSSYTTTVNVINGTITGTGTGSNYQYGNVFGGGLGVKAVADDPTTTDIDETVAPVEAFVYGEVHVNVGSMTVTNDTDENGDPITVYNMSGQATLIDCNIHGCNNQNGTPEQNVHVDIYQTAHTDGTDETSDNTVDGDAFAIHRVYGGGKESHFTPTGKKVYLYLHRCDNTVEHVFGGGDAANVTGTDVTIDGGRYDWVFGGGNGAVTPANITESGATVHLGGGNIGLLVNGSNEQGTVTGGVFSNNFDSGCGEALVTDYFLGSNQADIYSDIETTIDCESAMHYINLYCGSNLAQIYGNINVTIQGGEFVNLFGGSKGRKDDLSTQADESFSSNIQDYTVHDESHPVNSGGHVHLTLNGGKIGTLYGGCDQNGDIFGTITIDVNDLNHEGCELFIGDIYGGGNQTSYEPHYNLPAANPQTPIISPKVNIINGTIGGDFDFNHDGEIQNVQLYVERYEGNVFGGGHQGEVVGTHPVVTIGDKNDTTTHQAIIKGDVFGGGHAAKVQGNTKVILQGKATIDKDVFGGGKSGDVEGSTEVIIVPTE